MMCWEPQGSVPLRKLLEQQEIGGLEHQGGVPVRGLRGEGEWKQIVRRLCREHQGQDVAEYAVMLAVILVIVVGTIQLIGSNANNVFSQVASQIAQ